MSPILRAMPRRAVLSSGTAFWLQATVLIVLLAASSAPTPLYPIYQSLWDFPPVVLTVVFAVYALALLAALLTVGSLSDHIGRRPVLLAALTLEIASMLVFAMAESAAILIIARIIQGFATGAAIGAIGAYLVELEPTAHEGLGTALNSAGPVLGLAAGALASSLIFAAAPGAIHLVYLVLVALLVLQTIGTAFAPETATRRPGALKSLRPRVSFPAAVRPSALWVLPAAVAVWALGGLILSLGPNVVRSLTGQDSIVFTGLIVAALTGTGGLAIALLGRTPPARILALGMGALLVGMAGTLGAAVAGAVELYFAATIVAGIGFGAGFLGVMRTLLPLAAASERAGLVSAIYVVSYLAMSVPAVVAGGIAGAAGLIPTLIGYTGAVIVLTIFVLTGLLQRRRAGVVDPAECEAEPV
jgi:predicted MFS family arabinose efflux permease